MAYLVDVDMGDTDKDFARNELMPLYCPYRMEIIGENRFVFVTFPGNDFDGRINSIIERIRKFDKRFMQSVRCTPLRTYDGFARSVLGVSDTIAKPEAPRVNGGRFYWLHFQVEYKGMTQETLLKNWKEDAEAALRLRNKGILDLFKVVGQREVYMLMKADSAEAMDDFIFQMPLMKTMGDNVHIVTKEVRILK